MVSKHSLIVDGGHTSRGAAPVSWAAKCAGPTLGETRPLAELTSMAGYSDLWRSSIVIAVSYASAQTLCEVIQGRGSSVHRAARVSGSVWRFGGMVGIARRGPKGDKMMLCTVHMRQRCGGRSGRSTMRDGVDGVGMSRKKDERLARTVVKLGHAIPDGPRKREWSWMAGWVLL